MKTEEALKNPDVAELVVGLKNSAEISHLIKFIQEWEKLVNELMYKRKVGIEVDRDL